MPQGYGKPVQNTRPTPYRMRQDLGYIPARAMAEGDGGGGITSTGGPTAPILSLTPIATGTFLGNLGGTTAVPVATAFKFTNLVDVPNTYAGAALKAVRVNAGATALEFYTAASGPTPTIPLVNGASPMGIMEGNLQTIGVPYTVAKVDTRVQAFAAVGLLAARPVAPVVPAGGLTVYFASDNGKFYVWNAAGPGWVQIN